jgi:hypothetical protein
MWTWMRHLAAQQTTAPELATFLVLVTAVCVATSLLTYAIIMTIAWRVTLKEKSWLEVVFPSTQTLREHAGEYALAGITSLILGLTLAEKDRLVDSVLDMPASTFIDSSVVANVFPLGRLPTGADLHMEKTSFYTEVKKASATSLAGLVQGPLETGRAEGARAIFVAAAKSVLNRDPGTAARVASGLKPFAIVMMVVYVVWIAVRRMRALANDANDANDDSSGLNATVGRQLAVLGVCLALLLANPIGSPGAELLADSAVSAARVAPPQSSVVRELAVMGIQVQNKILASGTMGQDAVARGKLEELWDSLNVAKQRLHDLDQTVSHPVQPAGDPDSPQLRKLGADIEAVRNRPLLLAFSSTRVPFRIQGPSLNSLDTTFGLHWATPGQFRVSDVTGKELLTFTLQTGETRTVCVGPRGAALRTAAVTTCP